MTYDKSKMTKNTPFIESGLVPVAERVQYLNNSSPHEDTCMSQMFKIKAEAELEQVYVVQDNTMSGETALPVSRT